jgi:hypothetical protein
MKALYVICAALIVVNIVLIVVLAMPVAQAQAIGGSGGNITTSMQMFNGDMSRGVLVVVDTQREVMLVFEIRDNDLRPFNNTGRFDLQREFKAADEARKKK